jgi:xanthosine utilization system XapX-like protein
MPTLSMRQLVFGIAVGVFFAILQGDLPVPTLANLGIACSAPTGHGG